MISEKELIRSYNQTREQLLSGQYEKSIEKFRDLIKGFRALGLDEWTVKAYNGLGAAYARSDNEEMAVRSYFNGINYAKEHRAHQWSSLLYQNIGAKFFILADYKMAIRYAELALSEIRYAKQNPETLFGASELAITLNLVEFYIRDHQYHNAQRVLEEVEQKLLHGELFQQEGELMFLICKTELAWYQGDEDYAKKHIGEILDKITSVEVEAYNMFSITDGLVDVLREMGAYKEWGELTQYLNRIREEAASIPLIKRENRYRMIYYRETGQKEQYVASCVEQYERNVLLQEMDRSEKIRAMNIKVELKATAENIKDVQLKSLLDPLTGIQNRRALRNRMFKLEDNRLIDSYTAVGIVDIDCFKELNDAYGHLLGDEALKTVAHKLEEIIEDAGSVYRYGGDEFVFIIENAKEEVVTRLCGDFINRIEMLSIPNKNSKVKDILSLSIGCYIAKGEEELTSEELVDQADKALYEVKKAGKANYKIDCCKHS